jgi:adenosylcobinamide kinase/adenosylcobinamide-phosphate guanylyltransferase
LTFILGGARSGKSQHAERLADERGKAILYIATAQPLDAEMSARVAAHRQRRPPGWETLEQPTDVGRELLAHPPRAEVVLLDCLTLLVSNIVLQASPNQDQPDEAAARTRVEDEVDSLLRCVEQLPAEWLVVSNEVGQGIVPAYPVGRLFRDLLGWANKQVAARANDIVWMVAGIPVPIGQYRVSRPG